jgi:hypothetical protein
MNEPYEGGELLSWTVDEFVRHQRGPLWFFVVGIVGLVLLTYAILTKNFLFAVVILMFGVLVGLSSMRDPQKFLFVVTDLGIGIGDRFHPFKDLKNFWIVYEPPVKNIYFEFKRSPRPHLVVPLYEQDPTRVRDALMRFVAEDSTQEDEPFADTLARFLKL